jgi:hypothetical protein
MIRIVEPYIRTKYCYNHAETLTIQYDADACQLRIEPSRVEPGTFFEHRFIVCPSCSAELPMMYGVYDEMLEELMDYRMKHSGIPE